MIIKKKWIKNIVLHKVKLKHEIHDLDIRYV